MVPDVPITRSKPALGDSVEVSAHLRLRCLTSRRSSRADSGSLFTNRSVSRMTPSFEALAERQVRRGAERDLDASAADVDDDGGAAADIDAVSGGQMDQTGFLGAGDDPDPDAGLARHLGDEIAAVLSFPGGAGRGGDNFVHLVGFRQAPEFRQRLHGGGHGRRASGFCRPARRPPAGPYPFPGQSLRKTGRGAP